jgi:tetratricopeptide (TPR) repeat protein
LTVLGQPEEALADYRAVAKDDDAYPEIWCRIGHLLEGLEKHREALDAHLRARRQDPSRRCSHFSVVKLHLVLRQPGPAATAYRAGLRHGPFGAPFHANGALALRSLGRLEDALEAYDRALGAGPGPALLLPLLVSKGAALAGLGRHEDAMSTYERAIGMDGEHAPALNNLAMLLATCAERTMRDPARAVRLAERAARIDPRFRGTLGVACYRANDCKRAARLLEGCPAPALGGDGFFLAMALWRLGEQEKAREHLSRSVKWMEAERPADPQLARFREEAETLLGGR